MLLYGINNNILISHLSYLGLYHDEPKMRALQRDKYFFLGGNQAKKSGARFFVDIGTFN